MLYFSVTAIWGHMDVMLHALFQCYCNMGPHGCNVTCISVLLHGATWMHVTCFISVLLQWGHMDGYMLYFSVTAICGCNVTCFISVLLTIWGHTDVMLHALFQCYCNMGPHGCNVTCFISVLLQYGATWM